MADVPSAHCQACHIILANGANEMLISCSLQLISLPNYGHVCRQARVGKRQKGEEG